MTAALHWADGHPGALAILIAAAALAAALVAQYVAGLAPCPLCVWQRWPYVAALALGALALVWRPGAGVLALGAGLAFATTAGIAIFHAGVEEGLWKGLESCAAVGTADSLEAFRAQVLGQQPARCDQVAWSFLGLSIAGWNVLYASAGALVMFVLAARRLGRRA